jgi:hypothetical protein
MLAEPEASDGFSWVDAFIAFINVNRANKSVIKMTNLRMVFL